VGGRNILVPISAWQTAKWHCHCWAEMAKFFNPVFERFNAFGFQAEIFKKLSKTISAGWG
jgi:hypothetical protein